MLHQGAVDIGQGSNTVIAQISADALGLPLGDFRLRGADTAITPDAGKTSASRQTFVSGKAAEKAARALRDEILRFANVSDRATLRLDGATLLIREGDARRQIELARLQADGDGLVFVAQETYDPPTTAARRQRPRQALRRLWLWRADRRTGGRHEARHGEADQDHCGA